MRASDGQQDKFYTKSNIAEGLIQQVPDVANYPLIVEPSAGSGSFLRHLPERAIGYDIEPEMTGVIRQDWLTVTERYDGGLLIGNPPFGKRSSLARAFIRHGVSLGFNTIAFILPSTFRKLSMQRDFPADWSLILEEDLPDNAFLYGDEEIIIPCVFHIWTKRPSSLNLRKRKVSQPEEYRFLPRGSDEADICLNGNSGRVRRPDDVTNPKAEHYIKVFGDKDKVIGRLSKLPYDFRSSVSGGVSWISQNEINEAWNLANSLTGVKSP